MTLRHEQQRTQGTIIGGRYRLDRMLGEGGFATVYLAHHTELDTPVAVKCLLPEHLHRDDLQTRFRAEARTAARLESRHTVRVRDFGFDDRGAPYMVMDLVRGTTLEKLLEERGPLSEEVVARIALGVLESLAEAAEHGIVHRDIKPQNIFLADEREVRGMIAKVGDFGIAKLIASTEVQATRTVDGVLCTPQYAAPELLLREPVPASDLYSLGHVLAELLDGVAPYASDNGLQALARHLGPDPVALGPAASESFLRPVLERALAKPVEARFESAAQMRDAIETALDDAGLEPGASVVLGTAAQGARRAASRPAPSESVVPQHTPTLARANVERNVEAAPMRLPAALSGTQKVFVARAEDDFDNDAPGLADADVDPAQRSVGVWLTIAGVLLGGALAGSAWWSLREPPVTSAVAPAPTAAPAQAAPVVPFDPMAPAPPPVDDAAAVPGPEPDPRRVRTPRRRGAAAAPGSEAAPGNDAEAADGAGVLPEPTTGLPDWPLESEPATPTADPQDDGATPGDGAAADPPIDPAADPSDSPTTPPSDDSGVSPPGDGAAPSSEDAAAADDGGASGGGTAVDLHDALTSPRSLLRTPTSRQTVPLRPSRPVVAPSVPTVASPGGPGGAPPGPSSTVAPAPPSEL